MNEPTRPAIDPIDIGFDRDEDRRIESQRDALIGRIRSMGSVVVAFSGGVDSSVVAAAAHAALPGRAIAVTAVSPSLASWQADLAERVAAEIGIDHETVRTDEGTRQAYRRNAGDRCFYCKQTLYHWLQPIADRRDATILSGTNADDLSDHRPGIQAGMEAAVATPLADLRFGKDTVRNLARVFGLTNAELPASPCLASRIEYHVEVTPERLAMIDAAESWLRARGLSEVRVRLHAGEIARIEVPRTRFARIIELEMDAQLSDEFERIGFKRVSLDLRGFRSGSMNDSLIQISPTRSCTTSSPALSSHALSSHALSSTRERTDE